MTQITVTVKFDNEYEINITPDMNELLHLITIPETATTIIFNNKFNHPLKPGFIPMGVTKIIFGHAFNQKLEPQIISSGVTEIIFGNAFNQKIEPKIIPSSVLKLTFGKYYDQPIEKNVLPEKLESLFLNSLSYQHQLQNDVLPDSVVNFKFYSTNYTKEIPNRVTILIIDNTSKLDLAIPDTIKDIKLSYQSRHNGFFDKLGARDIPDAKYTLYRAKSDFQPLDVGRGCYLTYERCDSNYNYYNKKRLKC